MKPQSKSKTFPKGTTIAEIHDWMVFQFDTHEQGVNGKYHSAIASKYLITVVKYNPEKEEK